MQGKHVSFLLVGLLLFTPFAAHASTPGAQGRSSACQSDVCINELMPNPTGVESGNFPDGEWVELYNNGTSDVNLQGWSLWDAGGWQHPIDANTWVDFANLATPYVLPAGSYAIISEANQGTLKLNNAGETLHLSDSSGTFVHTVTTGTALENVSKVPDTNPSSDYIDSSSNTPGAPNSGGVGTNYYPSDLEINEVMQNPWPSNDSAPWPGGEWVEIKNNGTQPINLSGWSLRDAVGNTLQFNETHLIGDSVIDANELRIIALNGTRQWGILNNGQETLNLIWPNGSIGNSWTWYDSVAGFSMQLGEDGDPTYATFPTPGEENPLLRELSVNHSSDVIFTEVMPNGTNDGSSFEAGGEWVEIWNNGSVNIDMLGWKIMDGMGNITLIDGSTLVVNDSQAGSMINAGERRLVQFTQDTRLWDDYNHLLLIDDMDRVIDFAWWEEHFGSSVSLIRNSLEERAWIPASEPTPGQPEPLIDTQELDFIITEIYADDFGNDVNIWPSGEWIEIYNNGTGYVDIAGFTLTSGASQRLLTVDASSLPLRDSTVIAPEEYVVISFEDSSFYLADGQADAFELNDAQGDLIIWAYWTQSSEGESLERSGDAWVNTLWPTPGASNAIWPDQSADNLYENIAFNEVGTDENGISFVEIYNGEDASADLTGWKISVHSGDCQDTCSLLSQEYIKKGVMNHTSSFISSMDFGFIPLDHLLDDATVQIHRTDGLLADEVYLSSSSLTFTSEMGMLPSKLATPNADNVETSDFASPSDLLFSRLSTNGQITITNTGDKLAFMWPLQVIYAGQTGDISTYSFDDSQSEENWFIEAQASLHLSVDSAEHGNLRIVVDNQNYDTVVWGNGPTDVGTWSGVSVTPPAQDLEDLVYMRGDGCLFLPDSNTAEDWKMRWSIEGASQLCTPNAYVGDINFTPLIGPESGLLDLLNWMDGAQQSFKVHVYQIHHSSLVNKMIEMHDEGVEVNVVMQYPYYRWDQSSKDNSFGYFYMLQEAGLDVKWFGATEANPYTMMHSKVAVRDNSSVWMSTGNWKSSSLPLPDEGGNREWSAIIESESVTQMVLERLIFDENSDYVTSGSNVTMPNGWSPYLFPTPVGETTSSIETSAEISLLTCPDDCITGLADMIGSAESEILLSLQYLEMDWYWGWQSNPLLDALLDAAQRGVSIRLIMNAHYIDENPEVRDSVEEFNENWSAMHGYDVQAILMTENDYVEKVHNKGAIIDGDKVLISSINWGDNSILKNREMGFLIHSELITEPYLSSWWEDWNRTDDTTDSDADGMPDWWEIKHGFNRTQRTMSGGISEADMDADLDGFTNIEEYVAGTDPRATEITDNNTNQTQNGTNETNDTVEPNNSDLDNDGVINGLDLCPDTVPDAAVDKDGCSAEQINDLAKDDTNTQASSDGSVNIMLTLIIIAGTIFSGAVGFMLFKKSNEDEDKWSDAETNAIWNGESEVAEPETKQEGLSSEFPGWTEDTIQNLIDQGWTMDQLKDYYQSQVSEHQQ